MKKCAAYYLLDIAVGLFAGTMILEAISDLFLVELVVKELPDYAKNAMRISMIGTGSIALIVDVMLVVASIFLGKKIHKVRAGVVLSNLSFGFFSFFLGVIGIITAFVMKNDVQGSGYTYSLFPTILMYIFLILGGILLAVGAIPSLYEKGISPYLNAAGVAIVLVCYTIILVLEGLSSVSFIAILRTLAFYGGFILFAIFAFKYDEFELLIAITGSAAYGKKNADGTPVEPFQSAYSKPSWMNEGDDTPIDNPNEEENNDKNP